jgi:hypothetical protein
MAFLQTYSSFKRSAKRWQVDWGEFCRSIAILQLAFSKHRESRDALAGRLWVHGGEVDCQVPKQATAISN